MWMPIYATADVVTGIEVSTIDPRIVVLATRSDVLISEENGDPGSWHAVTPEKATGIRTIALSPHRVGVYVIGTNSQGIWYTTDGGATWMNNRLTGFFEQHLSPDQPEPLDPELATAYASDAKLRHNASVVVFAPVSEDTFYVAGTQRPHASVGVARVTQAGTRWQRLPLEGLTHRNVYALALSSSEQFIYVGTHDGTFGLALR
jgi:hypothetical protein